MTKRYTTPKATALKLLLAVLLMGPLLAACGSDDVAVPYVERPVEELYNDAIATLAEGDDYTIAAQKFEEVERQHPYSVWATKAQLMAAYSYYLNNSYDEAIDALDRFIALHPGSPDIAYAHYLKALSYYEQISDVERDQKMTRLALESLEEIVRRFPETEYARDAGLKIDLTRDHLAGKHMAIGRYYLRRNQYLAAINRFRLVIKDYQTTTHVPEALHRLVEANLALGLASEAQSTAAVLGYNFPGNDWYLDSYALLTGQDLRPEEDKGSWISRTWKSIF
ncbi:MULTISPECIES: outer membrane protein assembly factor BamD [Limibacillus]|jgi:outer membrane protein assembly factor BamD|uniref:Outer membrane protein assembly factor BamD n=1 Tax=Limibacillus halophilus TaxID=1579333 RepID=A0A839SRC2_9PROT|nr:outer membrane protein assembly factor BamD [Limibacillus halophilus]MBB3064838.1 outer membrane protein assembly factor BamD [Limibacillus halophilus]